MKKLTVEVPGKIILSGEHAVVYGHQAVVAAVDRTLLLSIEWGESLDRSFFQDLLKSFKSRSATEVLESVNRHKNGYVKPTLKSNIPIGCGMGSSAALAIALSTTALVLAGEEVNLNKINDHAFLLEKQAHKNPSGVDNTIMTFGGVMTYQKLGDRVNLAKVDGLMELNQLLIVNTGEPSESTGEMVYRVRAMANMNPKKVDRIMKQIGTTTKKIVDHISFGPAIKENEKALEELEVVSLNTQNFIREIEKRGGVAKVSGAGGFKINSGIVMVYAPKNTQVINYINETGLEFFPIKISDGMQYKIEEM